MEAELNSILFKFEFIIKELDDRYQVNYVATDIEGRIFSGGLGTMEPEKLEKFINKKIDKIIGRAKEKDIIQSPFSSQSRTSINSGK